MKKYCFSAEWFWKVKGKQEEGGDGEVEIMNSQVGGEGK